MAMTRPIVKKIKKVAVWGFTVTLTAAAVLMTVTIGWRPLLGAKARPLTNRQFERTPERLARGRYLVEGVGGCFDCHSQVDKDFKDLKPGEPMVPVHKGAGRVIFEEGDARLVAPNITPDVQTGAGTWTDDQIARAIREGIGHDGRTLFPVMPYQDFRGFSDEDTASIVVYLRSLPAVHNELPKRQLPFPLSRLINSAPQPLNAPVVADTHDQVARGKYIAEIVCAGCHTPKDKMGKPIPGMKFAGGDTMDGHIYSANITSDPSGISYYSEELFVKALRTGYVGARPLNPPMPWWIFRNMSDDDLKAIFAYLKTVPPVHHRIDNSEAAAKCKQCNGSHGGAVGGGL
jgi:mono/diheme cytochrome c family protein